MKTKLAMLAAAAVAATAQADLVIDTEPGNMSGIETVLLNDTGLITTGPMVQGMTSDSKLIVDYFGAGEDLVAGRARVMAVDGGLTQLSIRMDDPTLGIAAYRFNLDALGTGEVTINLFEQGSLSHTETFSVDERGPNWFRVYTTDKEVLSMITFTSDVEIGAVRNNGVYAVPNPVPEPSSFLALGVGLMALVALRRRS